MNSGVVLREREGWMDCLYLDCLAAFDTVLHGRLIKVNYWAGIWGGGKLQWIENYISERKQRTDVRIDFPEWVKVASRVLKPKLFLMSVDDLPEVMTPT